MIQRLIVNNRKQDSYRIITIFFLRIKGSSVFSYRGSPLWHELTVKRRMAETNKLTRVDGFIR